MSSRVKHWALACPIIALSILGCGEDGPETATVTGKITRGGQPVSGVGVTFYPAEGRPSSSSSNAEGVYELLYSPTRDGALIGEHTVRFVMPSEIKETAAQTQTEEVEITGGPPKEIEWPEKVNVKSGENTADFDLDRING